MPVGYRGAIFDVDGVLVDSSHEQAWRETLQLLMETGRRDIRPRTMSSPPEHLAQPVYQEVVAGKPRLSDTRAALDALAEGRLERRSR